MVDGGEELGFWLPAEFLDEMYTDEPLVRKSHHDALFGAGFGFPKDFPYETSDGGEKSWVMSTSPQSTLSRLGNFSENGSPNSVTSPPATPLSVTVEDLIHRAVGQVEMLKLSGGFDGSVPSYPRVPHVAPPGHLRQVQRERASSLWYGHHHQQAPAKGKVSGHVGWANPTRMTGPALSASANNGVGRRACAGTGVFLPRRYDNDEKIYNNVGGYAAESRMKTSYGAHMVTLERTIRAPPPNQHMGNATHNGSIKSQARVSGTHNSNYDMFEARRNALMLILQRQQQLLQQRRNMMMEAEASRGICLPQEWTY